MHRPSLAPHLAAEVIEEEKENIVPLQGGRPVSQLVKTLASSRNYSLESLREKLQHERNQFEQQLRDLEEQDDPLQAYLNYIDWTHRNFPQGAKTSSGLFGLLERCASRFRDISLYKNDPRYLKVWLEYIDYHDTPRDAYIYLATKKIGVQLALFYEEFARHLELKDKFADAHGVYEIGIQFRAFPIRRLEKSFQKFRERMSARHISVSSPSEDIRNALALKQGRNIEPQSGEQLIKRSKIEIFQDDAEFDLNTIQSAFEKESSQDQPFESRRSRMKENTLAPTRWSGQILQQKKPGPIAAGEKLRIFCDNSSNTTTTQGGNTEVCRLIQSCKDGNHVYTLIEVPGKRPEKVMLNMDLLYPDLESELSSIEYLATLRRSLQTRVSETNSDNEAAPVHEQGKDIANFTISSLEDTSKFTTKDPTVTMYSKMAKNEVFDIFNQASQTCEQSEFTETRIDDPTVTNFDGFVTETMHPQRRTPEQPQEHLIPTQADEPNTDAHDVHNTSSSFLFYPSSKEGERQPSRKTIDPFDAGTRHSILQNLVIPLTTYPGYFDKSSKIASQFLRISDFFSSANSHSNSHSMILGCLGDEMYSLVSCFKRQKCSLVCLVESESGCLKVLKILRPATSWEFFILRRIRRRLLKDLSHEKQFAKAENLFSFSDESFLVLEYYPQGRLMDIINLFKAKGKLLDECLVMFFSIRLLEATETLHGMDIIHGNINTENCMINFVRSEDRNFSPVFDRSGKYGWDKKRLTLINFSAAIDLTEFQKGITFTSSSRALGSGFINRMDGKTWTYEIDNFGVADTIHALLFDESLQIAAIDGKIQIKRSLSRFWQPQLWQELFEVLVSSNGMVGHQANALKLKEIRGKLEEWLESYAEAGNLKRTIVFLEEELGSI